MVVFLSSAEGVWTGFDNRGDKMAQKEVQSLGRKAVIGLSVVK